LATVGSIVLGMTTKTEKFDAGLKKSEERVKAFSVNIKASSVSLLKFVAGTAAFQAATNMIRSGLSAIGGGAITELGQVADRVGTTTAKLAELQYATRQTRGDVDALGPALQTLKLNMSDAAQQSGPVADALRQIGLNAATLDKMDSADAFKEVSKGLSKVSDEGVRTGLALKIVGTDAVGLMNTLSASNGAINKSEDQFRKFGGSITELARNQIDNATLALERVQAVGEGLAVMIAAKLAPYVEFIRDKFVEWMESGDGVAAKVGRALEWVANKFMGLIDIVQQIANPMLILANLTLKVARAIVWITGNGTAGLTAVIDSLDEAIARNDRGEKWSNSVKTAFEGIRAKSEATAKAVEKVGNAVVKTSARADEARGIWESTRTPLEKYRMEMERINTLARDKSIDADTARRARIHAGVNAGLNETKFAGAMTLGSNEARSTILQANHRDRFVNGDMQKSTAATAAYTRDAAISLKTLVQKAERAQTPVLSF
jgi:hypothetical protein